LAEHVDGSELGAIFEQHHPFFYSTFIDCFSNFDCASRDKQRTNTKNIREDLECILFALEKILVLTPDLIRRPLPGVSDSTKFGNLLQIFLTSSKLVFLVDTHNNATSLEDQVEMCKRIMNIYRFMVMKIFMNKRTWEQMLEVMMQITNHLFPREPPKRKEDTIGGRIAPAFFQTFIVSWIRANLYVHIGTPMWDKFQNIMSNLVRWRELLEEWSNTMDSLTRVLVKHVYDLNLGDLPLERPADRRRRNKAMKSFSTVETSSKDMIDGQAGAKAPTANKSEIQRLPQSKFLNYTSMRRASDSFLSKVSRSTSDGFLHLSRNKIYLSSPTSKDTYGLMVGDDDPHLTRQLRRFRSEYLSDNRDSYEDTMTNYKSRSPSPSRHFIDTASLKDSPLIIDSVSTNCSSYASASPAIGKRDTIGTSDKSVLVGGTVRGWTKDNAVIMWRRMLGLFGNINSIEDPTIHHVAMRCLVKILEDFIKVRENLGISQDNQSTPHIPTLVPPLNYFSAWLFQATYLPESFKSSKQLAYRLLCQASIRRHDFDLTNQYFACLYQSLHRGLTSHDQELKGVLIKHCNSLIYTSDLPGSSILAQDFIDAASFVLFSDRSEAPKLEAVQLLSCLMSLHRPFRKLMVLAPDPDSLSLVPCQDLKDKILSLLLSVNRLEDSHSARARIICALTAHIYQDLSDKSYDKDIIQAIDEVVASIKVSCIILFENS
ncbi:Ral GTPase-activating protein subunit alpha-2, partial [Fragariocoptes setiger]